MKVSEELCEWLDDMAEISGVGYYDDIGEWVWGEDMDDHLQTRRD